jgi:hypothetical protein
MPETSFFLTLLLQSALVPFGVALVVLAAGRAARLDASAPLLALAGGFLASYFATLHGQWSLVPKVALDWLPWIAVAGAVVAVATESLPSAGARVAARLLVAAVAGALVIYPAVGSLGVVKALAALAALALLVALVWTLKARAARQAATRPLLLAVVAGGAGLALMLDSSQAIGQLSGALAMTLATCMLFALPRFSVPFTPATTGVAVLLLAALLASAYVYAGFPLGYVALLAGALLIDPAAALIRRGQGGLPWIPAAVLTAIPVLVTVALAVKTAQDHGGY